MLWEIFFILLGKKNREIAMIIDRWLSYEGYEGSEAWIIV